MNYPQSQHELFRFFVQKLQPQTADDYAECNRLSGLMATCCTPTEKTNRAETTAYLIEMMSENSVNELRDIGEEIQSRMEGEA